MLGVSIIPDLIFVDGQRIAYPRRLGLDSYLGLCLNTLASGCAKSLSFNST
ncbi:endonuclease V [Chloroflexota bacterium]